MATQRQAVMHFDSIINPPPPAVTVNIVPQTLTSYIAAQNAVGVDCRVAEGSFYIKVPGPYLVLFNLSFSFSDAQVFNAYIYVNDELTPYGSHTWGLTSLRSSLSVMGLFVFNVDDKINIKVASLVDAQTLTIYDSHFIIVST